MRLEDFSRRASQLIDEADAVIAKRYRDPYDKWLVDAGALSGVRAAGLSFLENVFGAQHAYVRTFTSAVVGDDLDAARAAREILGAAKGEMEGGWNLRVRGLVAADLFSDMLGMVEHLLDEGYKDAAAVMAGGLLEAHLRQLANRESIPTEVAKGDGVVPKKADTLNGELASAGTYGKLDQKSVTGWLDLRNKAAHGQYDTYTSQQVELLFRSLTDFMARIPL